jgi:predicted SAM-dependent methyltransferase
MSARERLKLVPGLVPTVHAARAARLTARRKFRNARFLVGRLQQRRRVDAYLRTHTVRRLQLGTGANVYDGWLNTDVADYLGENEVVYLDVRKRFPLPDASIDIVFSEHLIEHVDYLDGLQCLRECHRVLRPGGRIRIATPSLRLLARLYDADLTDLQRRYLRWSTDVFVEHADAPLPGFVLNNMFHNFEHRFVYDDETLRHALETAGFVDVTEWPVGESDEPALVGVERHMRRAAEFNDYETLVLEARKA